MHQSNPLVCDEKILEALLSASMSVNELARRLHRNKRTVIRHLRTMERYGYVISRRVGKKKEYELTELGRDACAYFRIKRDAGYIGLEWAKSKAERGFKVRFLSDLTGLSQHERWLFAWNPKTGECDLAAIFGVRSLKSKEGPRYLAQLVDLEKSPDKPLKSAELFEYLEANIKDWNDEKAIAENLKSFWSLENFNAYMCVFVPEEGISFGFPTEIGHFSSLMFVGFGHQKCFPFIPKMQLMVGSFNISENLRVYLKYHVNLQLMLNYCRVIAKHVVTHDLVPPEELAKIQEPAFEVQPGVACINITGKDRKCKKMGVKCIAISDQGIKFSKCPILTEDIKSLI